jgi:hypothetical protein
VVVMVPVTTPIQEPAVKWVKKIPHPPTQSHRCPTRTKRLIQIILATGAPATPVPSRQRQRRSGRRRWRMRERRVRRRGVKLIRGREARKRPRADSTTIYKFFGFVISPSPMVCILSCWWQFVFWVVDDSLWYKLLVKGSYHHRLWYHSVHFNDNFINIGSWKPQW